MPEKNVKVGMFGVTRYRKINMIQKLISGGQQGSDLAGLMAAKELGIPTGGWMPKDWITLDGAKPEYKDIYGMEEHTGGYSARTEANVRDSDGTIRFAANFNSPGEKCTLKAIKWHNKPHLDVYVKDPQHVAMIYDWIKLRKIKVLNVAGNSEETSPRITKFVIAYLTKALKEDGAQ